MATDDSRPTTDHVGVRELRQNLSVYLRRIAAGEEFTVTERGRPVARLSALTHGSSLLERLVAEGKVTPPRVERAEWKPIPRIAPAGTPSSKQILDELREDRV